MKKNLFFEFSAYVLQYSHIARYSLFVGLFFPFFAMANLIPSENANIDPPQSGISGSLFISSDAVVVGIENVHLVEVESKKPIQVAKETSKKKTFTEEVATIAAEKLQEKAALELVYYNKNAAKPSYTFIPSPLGSADFLQKYGQAAKVAIPATNTLQHIALHKEVYKNTLFVQLQLKKQKYYTSISYLQSGKYTSASLRAPPSTVIASPLLPSLRVRQQKMNN